MIDPDSDTLGVPRAPVAASPALAWAPMPLLGRDGALVQLDGIFSRAVEYQAPQLVTVVGTQGVGKTRLMAEWLQRLVARYAAGTPGRPRVYRGRAAQGAGSYALISRLLRDRFGIVDTDDEARRLERVRTQVSDVFKDRRMTEVIHFIGRFLELKIPDNAFLRAVSFVEDGRNGDSIARTVLRRFLELDAERSPLVLAFDDLHLGDDDSLRLLGELAEGLGGSPVLMLAAARPELFVRSPSWGQGSVDHTRIDVGPLSGQDGERLLRGLLQRAEPLPAELIEDACELTCGNPYFIEELVRVFHSNGTITVEGERWRIDPVKAGQAELPMSVEGAIQTRISALSDEERGLLEKGATLGSVFWLGALVVLGRLDEDDPKRSFGVAERARAEEVLRELVERDYLLQMPDSSIPGELEYIFKHNLEHDLILTLTAPDRARRYYLLGAEWMESRLPPADEQSGEQLEFLASLYDRGGARHRAGRAYLAAADKARNRFAHEAAVELYQRGLKLQDLDDAIGLLDPLHNYGDALQRCGRHQEALAAFEEMLQSAWRLDLRAKAGAAHGRIGRVYRALGEYTFAEEHFGQALELFRLAGDTRGVAGAEDDLGRLAFLRGTYPDALERHARALDLRRAIGDERSLALSLHNLGMVHQTLGAHAEAVSCLSDALAIRRRIGDLPGVIRSLLAVASAWSERGEHDRTLEILDEAQGIAQEVGDRLEQAYILTRVGEALAQLGRRAEAADRLAQAIELAQAFGDRLLQSEAARQLAEVHLGLGDLRAARDEARRALELADRVGSRPAAAVAHRVLATVLARGGGSDEDRARSDRHFVRSIEILSEVGGEVELGRTYRAYGEVLGARGDADGAATFHERAGEIAARTGARAGGGQGPTDGA